MYLKKPPITFISPEEEQYLLLNAMASSVCIVAAACNTYEAYTTLLHLVTHLVL
jgi:hypothetical protein